MSAQSDMVAAVNAAEAALVQLAGAYTAYLAAYRVAAQAVYQTTPGPTALMEKEALAHACGPDRLAQFAHGRLIALGAQHVVRQAGAMAPAGPEWTAYLTNQIRAPCAGDCRGVRDSRSTFPRDGKPVPVTNQTGWLCHVTFLT